MTKIIKLCSNHIKNLQNNTPCASCPVLDDPDKYREICIRDKFLNSNLSICVFTILMIIITSLILLDDGCDSCNKKNIDVNPIDVSL